MINQDPVPLVGANREIRTDRQHIIERKKMLWQAKIGEVNGFKDKAGTPVDEGIKQTVVAFNLLDIPTSSSCEGHADEPGRLSPWINISFPDSMSVSQRAKKVLKVAEYTARYYKKKKETDPNEWTKIRLNVSGDPIRSLTVDMGADDAYEADRERFIIGSDERTMANVTVEEMEQRKVLLRERQKEMRRFTDFLKNEYFSH